MNNVNVTKNMCIEQMLFILKQIIQKFNNVNVSVHYGHGRRAIGRPFLLFPNTKNPTMLYLINESGMIISRISIDHIYLISFDDFSTLLDNEGNAIIDFLDIKTPPLLDSYALIEANKRDLLETLKENCIPVNIYVKSSNLELLPITKIGYGIVLMGSNHLVSILDIEDIF